MAAIGLSGFAQTGKTTAAEYIEKVYGFKRVHIAATLRSMLKAMLLDLGYSGYDIHDILEGKRKDGWTIPEIGRTSREIQISVGTEWGRELVHPDLWVKTWGHLASQYERAMNDSVRFPNEEAGIKELEGFTILIERPGTGPAAFKWKWLGKQIYKWFGKLWGAHDSERVDRLKPSYVVVNDGLIGQLYSKIDDIMAKEGIKPVLTSWSSQIAAA